LDPDDDAQRDREAEQSRDSAKFRNFVFCGFVDIPSNHSTLAHFSEEAGDCDYDDCEGKAERGRCCEEEGSVHRPCWREQRIDRHSEARSPSPELKGLRPCSQNRKLPGTFSGPGLVCGRLDVCKQSVPVESLSITTPKPPEKGRHVDPVGLVRHSIEITGWEIV